MINLKIKQFFSGSAPFVSGAAAITLAIAIVLAPESSFKASLEGLKLWWTLVFPALLPFLILSEMLTASGLVHGLGVLLEPVMRRLFRLPGAAGWTLVLGITAGFPAGAGAVMQLHAQGDIPDKDAGRLASLVHYASPVTLLIVVGTAFLHSPSAGYALLAIHWLSGLAAGCTAALIGRQGPASEPASTVDRQLSSRSTTRVSLPRRVRLAALDARSRDGRGFGKVLGESVTAAVQNLMIVGGYMIMFAVVINILARLIPQLPPQLAAGLLEIHLGARAMTTNTTGTQEFLMGSLLGPALLSAALAWSGVCAQLQALTVLRQAKVRLLPFTALRLLHGLIAFALTLMLWKPLLNARTAVLPVYTGAGTATLEPGMASSHQAWSLFPQILGLQGLLLLLLLALSAAVQLFTWRRRLSG